MSTPESRDRRVPRDLDASTRWAAAPADATSWLAEDASSPPRNRLRAPVEDVDRCTLQSSDSRSRLRTIVKAAGIRMPEGDPGAAVTGIRQRVRRTAPPRCCARRLDDLQRSVRALGDAPTLESLETGLAEQLMQCGGDPSQALAASAARRRSAADARPRGGTSAARGDVGGSRPASCAHDSGGCSTLSGDGGPRGRA